MANLVLIQNSLMSLNHEAITYLSDLFCCEMTLHGKIIIQELVCQETERALSISLFWTLLVHLGHGRAYSDSLPSTLYLFKFLGLFLSQVKTSGVRQSKNVKLLPYRKGLPRITSLWRIWACINLMLSAVHKTFI